ncbi:insulin receptor substrate 1-B isoform X2 [Denticeps clupeoides]|uniref:Insulin receptor substrate 1 n=1 Tax=Denticeps clupeoides TaxID=299321 RepID=A0A8C4APF1_9TELE|nr:insulin receptor substrate 1-B-like isoform X2 [Denticeps clupeoides]XP_028855462.1 insulin receptor substrate 1-B-like isoform X2 [Denticeps clupeoides]
MENQPAEQHSYEDVRKAGYLRKQKSMHRRYFVLRAASERGPARLEYYESEKKFRGKAPAPKKALELQTCLNINKRADAKNKHMIVLYTRAESFAVAADSEADQDDWFQAMVDMQCRSKIPFGECGNGDYGVPSPGPAFKEVWQVKVWPKGLGQAKNLVGIYRLCLTEKTVNFVKLNSDAAGVVLQLMNVRRCGHSENFFFVEVGRSAVTGPGEFWMQVEDSVVAQNMHETLLEAMKALSEEFRQRSKSQSGAGAGGGGTASNPISVPSRRHHPNPPPSQVGLTRRPRTETPGGGAAASTGSTNASPTPRHSFPRSRTPSDGGKLEDGGGGGGNCPAVTPSGAASVQSTSPATNGSCSSTPILRSTSVRAPTPVKNTHSLMRSSSTPAAASQTSSPSALTGHGLAFGTMIPSISSAANSSSSSNNLYSHLPSLHASISGSLSDYASSDEYGSSPGEHSVLTSSLPQGSVGSLGGEHFPSDEAANYILMGQKRGTSKSVASQYAQPQGRRVLRRSSSRECEAERRILSKRASLPPMSLERLVPNRRRGGNNRVGEDEVEEDDYAVMSRSTSRESFTSHVTTGPGSTAYLDVAAEFKGDKGVSGAPGISVGGASAVDNGYMSMLPGVTASPVSLSHSFAVAVSDSDGTKPVSSNTAAGDDYMAMTPNNSVSPPQTICQSSTTDGYMMMSPNSSCSPDQRCLPSAWVGSSSADSRTGSDYMNMSPISTRSANSTPPLLTDHSHPHHHQQQAAPKMVYSYYSLPRSYKHNPTAPFDDGPGRGKKLGGGNSGGKTVVGAGLRGVASSKRQERQVGSPSSRQLSLSSSSYSSSSASSESLGECDEKVSRGSIGGAADRAKEGQQVRGPGLKQQGGSSQRSRPVSLFLDISKANTLPRVRENPLPPEPKSPGEYVSIEFKGEKSMNGIGGGRRLRQGTTTFSSTNRPQNRPVSCLAGFLPATSVAPILTLATSEYVNMELCPSPSPSPVSLNSMGFPSFTPPTPAPAVAPQARDECQPRSAKAEERAELRQTKGRKMFSQAPDSPTACGDYTEMAFSLTTPTLTTSSASPKGTSPDRPESSVSGLSLGLPMDFPLGKTSPNPDYGAKVIRADVQGRRRHCSETFLASCSSATSLSGSSTSGGVAEYSQAMSRRLGFDGLHWANGASASSDLPLQYSSPGPPSLPTVQASSVEQGLNYIDLDLVSKEGHHSASDAAPPIQSASSRLFSSMMGGGIVGGAVSGGVNTISSLNTYASIDFYKSEELRTHQSSSKDGTEC